MMVGMMMIMMMVMVMMMIVMIMMMIMMMIMIPHCMLLLLYNQKYDFIINKIVTSVDAEFNSVYGKIGT